MDPKKLSRNLLIIGGSIFFIALLWWSQFYGAVARELGTSVGEFGSCLFSSGGHCGFVTGLAQFGGANPYQPMLFWVGLALCGVGMIVQYSQEENGQQNSLPSPMAHELAFFDSATRDDISVLAECIRNGVDLNARNKYGATALFLASLHNSKNAITSLLNAGADPCIPNLVGKLPIQAAREAGHSEIVALLEAAPSGASNKQL